MSKQIITPSSERAKMNMSRMSGDYHGALEKVRIYDKISLKEAGFDWNATTLSSGRGSSIDYRLGNEYTHANHISGRIHNGVTPIPVIEAYDPKKVIGCSTMTQDYIVESLSEAVKIARKLNIMENTEFLPEGEQEPGIKVPNGNGGEPRVVDERMRAFVRELTDLCDELIVGRVNKVFGSYVVVKTKQGWYMAYNKSYGEAPYIVPDIQDLLQDKQFLIQTGGAIRLRRDHRADWTEKLRRFL